MKTIANCGISKRLSGLSLSVSMSMSLLFFALLYGGNTFSVQAHSYDFSHNASGEAQQVSSPGPEPTVTIAFGDLTWPSALLQTRIAQYIAEMGYGYATTVEASSPQPLFRALRAGDIDVLMELWLPHQEVDWERGADRRRRIFSRQEPGNRLAICVCRSQVPAGTVPGSGQRRGPQGGEVSITVCNR